jgi:hypothetical protein
MNPTTEIVVGSNGLCILDSELNSGTVTQIDVPPGRYRLIDEAKIEELWDEWVDCLEGQDKEQVTMILTAAGLGRMNQND